MASATTSYRRTRCSIAAEALAALGIPTEWHLSPGIGHGIDQEGLRHGGAFLARRFAGYRSRRHCEPKASNPEGRCGCLDCFVASLLAMTAVIAAAGLQDPLHNPVTLPVDYAGKLWCEQRQEAQ